MKKIFIIGAGYVANELIKYLLNHAQEMNWQITVGDLNLELAKSKINNHSHAKAIQFDVKNEEQCKQFIAESDVVISLLPSFMHHLPAKYCLAFNAHLITASYVSDEIAAMNEAAKSKGLLFLSEMGLDPGIDHMIIMDLLNQLKSKGANVTALRSFTGGLIAPESDNNPWKYKFTWAPKNVIKAGQGTAQYIKNGAYQFVPYRRLFKIYDELSVEGYGNFEAYANRDSLSYMSKYGLEKIPTFIRGTLRKQGFCDSWHCFVKLGLTNDDFPIIGSENFTYAQLIDSFLPDQGKYDKATLKQRLATFLQIEEADSIMQKIEWTGILEDKKINIENATPAQILQSLLEEKWKLQAKDKDLIVMIHILDYELNGKQFKLQSDLIYKGENANDTAMGRLVGMPLAIATKLVLTNKISLAGVQIPIDAQIYKPVIKELQEYGVEFNEQEIEV